MRSAQQSFHPLIYLLIGLLLGGGIGFIVFWGFPTGISTAGEEQGTVHQNLEGELVPVEVDGRAQFGMGIGSMAPDFVLKDVNGQDFRLSEFRGQVVLLNFWATWCGPCQVEMPLLESTYQSYRDQGFIVLAINAGETQQQIEEFGKQHDLNFPLLLDPGSVVQQLYEIRGYPSSVVVDELGQIVNVHIGLIQERQLVDYLSELGFGS